MSMFGMNQMDLKQFEKFLKQFPKEGRRTSANVLNDMAFETRTHAITNLNAAFVIRSQGLSCKKFCPGSKSKAVSDC